MWLNKLSTHQIWYCHKQIIKTVHQVWTIMSRKLNTLLSSSESYAPLGWSKTHKKKFFMHYFHYSCKQCVYDILWEAPFRSLKLFLIMECNGKKKKEKKRNRAWDINWKTGCRIKLVNLTGKFLFLHTIQCKFLILSTKIHWKNPDFPGNY